MYSNITVINPEALIQAFDDVACGRKYVAQISSKDFYTKQKYLKPLPGYVPPEGFPNCCSRHRSILKIGADKLEKFPDCCESHKKLRSSSWFKKGDYSYLPLKLVTTLTYSLHCIGEYIETENWYKGITDYILEAVASYGQLPDGYGSPVGIELYLHNLERNFDSMKGIPDHKKKAITDYINTFFVPSKQKSEFPDLNVLIGLYKKWLKEFPFELSFLSHLKPKFEKQMPILSGKGDTNLYSGFTSFSLISVKGLIDFLVSITEQILSEFNTLNLYQSGLITDADKIKLELVVNGRKSRLVQGYKKNSHCDESRYRKILKEWFQDEKKFMDEITPLLQTPTFEKAESKLGKLSSSLSAHDFFELPKVKELSEVGKEKLIELIASNKLPYNIAMFSFLGFLERLEKNHYAAKYKMYKEISKWLNSDKEGRAVKANISSLLKNSSENKARYTAYKHKEAVQTDYQNIK